MWHKKILNISDARNLSKKSSFHNHRAMNIILLYMFPWEFSTDSRWSNGRDNYGALFPCLKFINVVTLKRLCHLKSTNTWDLGSLREPCVGVCACICLESPSHRSQFCLPWKRLQVVNKTSSTSLKAGNAREQLRLLTIPKWAWWGEGFSINIHRGKIDSLSKLGLHLHTICS